jgi:hypothetical protein
LHAICRQVGAYLLSKEFDSGHLFVVWDSSNDFPTVDDIFDGGVCHVGNHGVFYLFFVWREVCLLFLKNMIPLSDFSICGIVSEQASEESVPLTLLVIYWQSIGGSFKNYFNVQSSTTFYLCLGSHLVREVSTGSV